MATDTTLKEIEIHGYCDPRFSSVKEAPSGRVDRREGGGGVLSPQTRVHALISDSRG